MEGNRMETSRKSTNSIARRRIMKSLMVLSLACAPMAVMAPAEAAPVCGSIKTVRVSINYRACDEPASPGNYVAGYGAVQNNHGSAVNIKAQGGWIYGGGAINWNSERSYTVLSGWTNLRESTSCAKNQKVGYVFRVRDTNGSWGVTSYATPVIC